MKLSLERTKKLAKKVKKTTKKSTVSKVKSLKETPIVEKKEDEVVLTDVGDNNKVINEIPKTKIKDMDSDTEDSKVIIEEVKTKVAPDVAKLDDAFHQMIEDTSLKLGREKAIDLLRKLVKLSSGSIDNELTSAVSLYGNRRELINDYMNLAGDNAKQEKREEYKKNV